MSETWPNQRRVVMQFEGTAAEFKSFLAQLSTLVDDQAYEWSLTASIARHPAGKRLGGGDGHSIGRPHLADNCWCGGSEFGAEGG